MDFTLKYRGEVGLGDGAAIKHALRFAFHEQLREIWRSHNVLSESTERHYRRRSKARTTATTYRAPLMPSGDQDLSAFLFRFTIGGTDWIPLVTLPMEAHCYLAVRLGKADAPREHPVRARGHRQPRQDRSRCVADARAYSRSARLRAGGGRDVALLADDSLVTRLSITSYQLLTGYSSDEFMDVDIDVTVRAITPMAGTWALLF
jgi:hypothetical protein